jgi:hypothetical protein
MLRKLETSSAVEKHQYLNKRPGQQPGSKENMVKSQKSHVHIRHHNTTRKNITTKPDKDLKDNQASGTIKPPLGSAKGIIDNKRK